MNSKLQIETKYGTVQGFTEDNICRWYGIPFAKPPVGELRFKRAVEPDSSEEIRSCTKMGPAPVKFAGGRFARLTRTDTPQSEDCLYLNIWAPENRSAKSSLPVFIYIFGGGCHTGEASVPEVDLSAMARDGAIGVNFNYRLGPLGFYDFSKYDSSFESNCGFSDVLMALKWVHENIAAFGGDPDRVTVCGESAGGVLVYSLLASPVARPYFKQAISMSGLPSNVAKEKMHSKYVEKFINELGLSTDDISALHTMSTEKMAKVSATFFEGNSCGLAGALLPAVVVDDLVPKFPLEAIEAGECIDKKLMLGTCHDEGTLFYFMKLCPMSYSEIAKMLENNGYSERVDEILAFYKEKKEAAGVCRANRDRMFVADNLKAAVAQSRYGQVYVYRFDFVSRLGAMTGLKATHTFDIGPALDSHRLKIRFKNKGSNKSRHSTIHRMMHESFMNFIKSGNPSTFSIGEWKQFTKDNFAAMFFNDTSQMQTGVNEDVYELWKDIELYRE